MHDLTAADKIAMYGGGGLVLLGTFVIGLLEMIAGSPHAVEQDGMVAHDALVALHLRSYIILAGLLIWGLYAVYKLVATTPRRPGTA